MVVEIHGVSSTDAALHRLAPKKPTALKNLVTLKQEENFTQVSRGMAAFSSRITALNSQGADIKKDFSVDTTWSVSGTNYHQIAY